MPRSGEGLRPAKFHRNLRAAFRAADAGLNEILLKNL